MHHHGDGAGERQRQVDRAGGHVQRGQRLVHRQLGQLPAGVAQRHQPDDDQHLVDALERVQHAGVAHHEGQQAGHQVRPFVAAGDPADEGGPHQHQTRQFLGPMGRGVRDEAGEHHVGDQDRQQGHRQGGESLADARQDGGQSVQHHWASRYFCTMAISSGP
ncbi:hypothetical protein G6F65_016741 [Rhizopus arrhizus]|nr:hypothetical protein G6F65_016741 [Rhizopus arrhizus]